MKQRKSTLLEEVSHVEGWLTHREAGLLFNQAKKVKKPKVIVEIGSWKGRSTICLGAGSRKGGVKVYAIDPHVGSSEHREGFGPADTFNEFNSNIKQAGLERQVIPLRKTANAAVRDVEEPIGLLFIDGEHKFKSVREDYANWAPKVVEGGVIAFHDTWRKIGPNLTTAIELIASPNVRNPRLVDSITYFEKVARNSFYDRVRNVAFLAYRTLFGVVGYVRLGIEGKETKVK